MSSTIGNDHRTSEEGESLTSPDLGIDGGSILTAVSQIKDACLAIQCQNQKIEGRIKGLEDSFVRIRDAQRELSLLMKKYAKSSFTIKGTMFEVRTLLYSL